VLVLVLVLGLVLVLLLMLVLVLVFEDTFIYCLHVPQLALLILRLSWGPLSSTSLGGPRWSSVSLLCPS
jgi:hypothetical protein